MVDFKERLAKTQAKMEALKAKIDDTAETAKTAYQLGKEEIQADLAEVDKAIDELDAELRAQVQSDINDFNVAADEFDAAVQAQIDDDIATIQGDINAARENSRLAKERRQSKLNAARLKAQMNVNAAKARITEKKEARDMAKQEKRIVELLDYADDCQALALAMALESKIVILEAAAETADYLEKYGE